MAGQSKPRIDAGKERAKKSVRLLKSGPPDLHSMSPAINCIQFPCCANRRNRTNLRLQFTQTDAEAAMARVCISLGLLALLAACAAEQNSPPAASLQQDSLVSQAKGVIACTGLPLGGQKCVFEEQKPQAQVGAGNEKA
jgi:hypothetical protein